MKFRSEAMEKIKDAVGSSSAAAVVSSAKQRQKQPRFVPVRYGNDLAMKGISVARDIFLNRNGSLVARGMLNWNAHYLLKLKDESESFGVTPPSKDAILKCVESIYLELKDCNGTIFRRGSANSMAKTFPAAYWEELTVDLTIRVICKHLCAILAKKTATSTIPAPMNDPSDADIQELGRQQQTPDDFTSCTSSDATRQASSPFIAHLITESDAKQTPCDETVETLSKDTLDPLRSVTAQASSTVEYYMTLF